MKACLDVHYSGDEARAAALVFDSWTSGTSAAAYAATLHVTAPYEPGRFYLRELRPLLAVTARIAEPIEVFILDGYCTLSADGAPGLGAYFYAAIERRSAVIGVAKRRYRDTAHAAEVMRGRSRRPLFVTACGMSQQEAASTIAAMAGPFRLPTLLRAVDQLARSPDPL